MKVIAAKSLKKRCGAAKKRAVRCVDTGTVYASSSDAADILSLDGLLVDPRNILHVCQGLQKRAGGLMWEYAEGGVVSGEK
jgi:hypothetical protein